MKGGKGSGPIDGPAVTGPVPDTPSAGLLVAALEIRYPGQLAADSLSGLVSAIGSLLPAETVEPFAIGASRPGAAEAQVVGFFRKPPDQRPREAQRRAVLSGLDLGSPNLDRDQRHGFALLIPTGTLQSLADEALLSKRLTHNQFVEVLSGIVKLHRPATATVDLTIFAGPGVVGSLAPPLTRFSAYPRLTLVLSTRHGRLAVEGSFSFSKPQLKFWDGLPGHPVTASLQAGLDGVESKLQAMPTEILLATNPPMKLELLAYEVACNPRSIEGANQAGTTPAGMVVTGEVDVVDRQPAAHIVGPESLQANTRAGAHAFYQLATTDLRGELSVSWTSDGTLTTPHLEATSVGWAIPRDAPSPTTEHWVSATVTDADGITVEAKKTVSILCREALGIPPKPRLQPEAGFPGWPGRRDRTGHG